MASDATEQVEQAERAEEAEPEAEPQAEQPAPEVPEVETVAVTPYRAPAPVQTLPTEQEMRMIERMAQHFAHLIGTEMVPAHLKSGYAIVAILLKARELGIPATEALSGLYIVKGGTPTLNSNLMHALLLRSGVVRLTILEDTAQRARIQFERLDRGTSYTAEYTMAEAQGAELAGKEVWQKYPSDLLFARCLSRGARRTSADITTGLYIHEELDVPVRVTDDGDVVLDDTAVAEITDVPAVPADLEVLDAEFHDEMPTFAESEAPPERACPKCGKPLALRDGKRGPFWSCTGWRRDGTGCDHTEDAKPAEAEAEDIPEGFGDEDDGSEWEGKVAAEPVADRRVRLADGTWLLISAHAVERGRERLGWEPEETRRRAEAAGERFMVGEHDGEGRTLDGNAIFSFAAAGPKSIVLQTIVEGGRQGEVPLGELAGQEPEPEPEPKPEPTSAPDDEPEPEEDDPIGAREAEAMAAELAEIQAEGCPHTLATYKTMLRERGVTTGDEAQELFAWACGQAWGERGKSYRPDGLDVAEWQQIWPRIVGLLEATKSEAPDSPPQ